MSINFASTISDSSHIVLQTYYDRTEREDTFLKEDRDTFDTDFTHKFKTNTIHEIIWGLGYRFTHDNIEDSPVLTFKDNERWDHLFSSFIQDEITLIKDKLYFIAGSKLEYNSYTEFELQPNVRLLWNSTHDHTVWTSVSRAVRTPSRVHTSRKFL